MTDSTSSYRDHETAAEAHADAQSIAVAVLTISDSRTTANDRSGDAIVERIERAGHRVAARELVPDDADHITTIIERWCDDPTIRAILTTGGTGIAPRDTTVEVVRRHLIAELDGFGELFRMLSFEEIGAAAMMSRAVAGIAHRDAVGSTVIAAMPGSTNAVCLAMDRLLVPQLPHLIWERARQS
ncbi:MAG: MogA/MoaB family molybdenum cofactor biosynthesis protein [Planctomycetota bacterium]